MANTKQGILRRIACKFKPRCLQVRFRATRSIVFGLSFLAIGCDQPDLRAPDLGKTTITDEVGNAHHRKSISANKSNRKTHLLFIGNSHTAMHDLPNLIGQMIRSQGQATWVESEYLPVVFLEDGARNQSVLREVESGKWTHVILQGQKISMSGQFEYSLDPGIDLAKRARERGAEVIFYPEWGRRGVDGDGARQEQIYGGMAKAAGVGIAPVAWAWDLALAARPEILLYDADGNHQSKLGAFLTAAVLVGEITGTDPTTLAEFDYPAGAATDRRFLARIAADALKQKRDLTNEPFSARATQ